MRDHRKQTSDDAALEEMMDVDFPINDMEVDDSVLNTSSNKNDESKVPVTDICKDGWDDDAIVKCLNLAVSYHDGETKAISSLEFNPVPNMKRDISGKVHSLLSKYENELTTTPNQCDPEKDASINTEIEETDKTKSVTPKAWVPSELTKPEWATNLPR